MAFKHLLLPSLNLKDVFGGIATAYRFFQIIMKVEKTKVVN